jgi:branched-chain amino acid transport system permease protein
LPAISVVFEQIINGLVLGSMYALVASGLTLIWGAMRMLNFAQGEFYMLGGYLAFYFMVRLGLHPVPAILLVLAVVFVLGILSERLVVHFLLGKPQWEFSTIVATLGLGILLQNAVLQLFGAEVLSIPYLSSELVDVGTIRLSVHRVIILCVAVVSITLLWYLLQRTTFGLRLRAASQDRDAAILYGVNFSRMYTMTFGLSCLLAWLAAVMLAPIFSVNPWMGTPPLLKGFVVVVLGGLGNFQGAILGGLLLGIAESLGVIAWPSEWREVVSFAVLIIAVTLRPWGLFGNKFAAH